GEPQVSSAARSTPRPFAGLAAGECVLAADIGGTKTTTAWVDSAGRVHGTRTDPSRALLGPDSVLGVTTTGLRHAHDDATASGQRPVAIGVGTAGVVEGGTITSATDAIIDWVGTDVAGALRTWPATEPWEPPALADPFSGETPLDEPLRPDHQHEDDDGEDHRVAEGEQILRQEQLQRDGERTHEEPTDDGAVEAVHPADDDRDEGDEQRRHPHGR